MVNKLGLPNSSLAKTVCGAEQKGLWCGAMVNKPQNLDLRKATVVRSCSQQALESGLNSKLSPVSGAQIGLNASAPGQEGKARGAKQKGLWYGAMVNRLRDSLFSS